MSSFYPMRSVFRFFQHRFLRTCSTVIHNESAISSSSKPLASNPNSSEKHESVLSFFKLYGFSDAHLAKIVAKRPRILQANVGTTLKPKLDCLADYGISGSILHKLIASDPCLLENSLNSTLQPTLHLLKTYLGTNEKVAAAVKRCHGLLTYKVTARMQPNLNILISEKVHIASISRLISLQPRTITQKVDRMVYAVKSAKQYGFRPNDPMFVHAIAVILSMSESTFTKKIELVKNLLGCSEEEFNSAFKRSPFILVPSEEKLKHVTDVFLNTMKFEASVLLSTPVCYTLSVEKRIVPRYEVYRILESKKLLKKGVKFTSLLKTGEEGFASNYVRKYLDKVPNLMELYLGLIPTGDTQSLVAAANRTK